MKLPELLVKHNISISNDVRHHCELGIEIMKDAQDLSHSDSHIYRIFRDLDLFLCENKEIKKNEIDFEALLLAICWHDVWRSKKLTTNILRGAYVLFWDGRGSVKMYKRHNKKIPLSKKLSASVIHAIKKHAFFQIKKPKSLEAKILKDLDQLELFSTERVREIAETYYQNNKYDGDGFAQSLEFFFNRFLKAYPTKNFFFLWSQEMYITRRQSFIEFVAEYIKKHQHELDTILTDETEENPKSLIEFADSE